MSERIYKRREVRARLNVTKYGYQQLIDGGILEKPVKLTVNSHPFHTESQIQAAERALRLKANPPVPTPKARKTKPISARMAALIRP